MIPIDFQVTSSKVKVKQLFWAQCVVRSISFNPFLTCFGQVLLLQRRYTWILHHGEHICFWNISCFSDSYNLHYFYRSWGSRRRNFQTQKRNWGTVYRVNVGSTYCTWSLILKDCVFYNTCPLWNFRIFCYF